jgi:teichuronic acid biosynthesis glycosyltransferase TuaH
MNLTLDKTEHAAETHAPPLIKGRDIVVIGLQPWYYEIGSNCKNIATQLSKHNRVLYVNLPINRKTWYSKDKNAGIAQHCSIIREKGEQVKEVKENLWQYYPATLVESINWLPFTPAFKAINHINNRRLAKDIRKALAVLGFENIILFNDNDFFNGYGLKELLSPDLYIYYCRDYLLGYDYWQKHGKVLEPELVKKADVAVANSIYLSDYCSGFNRNSYYIGQGCNIELFDPALDHPLPSDLAAIPSPIIGYVGAVIRERLDEKIIEVIAKANRDWSVVLVGPEDEFFRNSSLHQVPNIYFLGRKDIKELPAYVNGFDVCINPQRVNNITIGNYPLKVDEYLAMGKPVVASHTRTMEMFENHTYLAKSPEEYPALVEKALAENDEDKKNERMAFARSHTWENSVGELYRVIKKHLKN